MSNSLQNALDNYYDTFDEPFPTMQYRGMSDDDIIALIDKCITTKKTIEEIDPPKDDAIY